MRGPVAGRVTHLFAQQVFYFVKKRLAPLRRNAVERGALEGLEPAAHAGRQGRWTGYEIDLTDGEPVRLKTRRVLGRRCVVTMNIGVPPAVCQHASDGDLDSGDVAVAAKLGDEAAARLQRAVYAGEHRVVVAHPMECGVRKHRVEFVLEGQLLGVDEPRVESARGRRRDHLRRRITPTTVAPAAIIFSVSEPSPQPTSRMRSPACGFSSPKTAAPSAGTYAALA